MDTQNYTHICLPVQTMLSTLIEHDGEQHETNHRRVATLPISHRNLRKHFVWYHHKSRGVCVRHSSHMYMLRSRGQTETLR